jgi:hypothetical protein
MRMKSQDHRCEFAPLAAVTGWGSTVGRYWKGLMIVAVVALSGCVSSVSVMSSPDAQPLTVPTVEPSEHQLGIVAVDFDPPLDSVRIAPGDGVTLMVAVENQGQSDESNVYVTARLLDPGVEPAASELLDETVVLTKLLSGQLQIVRFPQVSAFPLLDRYRLEVTLEPVAGETETDDNFRTYEIIVSNNE